MLKKIISYSLLSALLCLFVFESAFARAQYDRRDQQQTTQAKRIGAYSMPEANAPGSKFMKRQVPTDINEAEAAAQRRAVRSSVGSSATSGPQSPGFSISKSFMDDQYRPDTKGRQVDFRDEADILFVYNDAPTAGAASRFGFNAYNPDGGAGNFTGFGYGTGVGVTPMQAADETGTWPKLDVIDGRAIVSGVDNAGSAASDHVVYEESAWQSGFFSQQPRIAQATYNTCFFDAADEIFHPVVEVQRNGADIITHMVGGESITNTFGTRTKGRAVYFRRVNNGAWQGPLCVDTTAFAFAGAITSSRNSGKVTISYTKHHVLGDLNDQLYDIEIYYRTSTDYGANWGPKTNLTNYPRNVASHAAFLETHSLYDSNDNLHIIWNAEPFVADPYNDPTFFFGDFSASIFHWASNTGIISRIHNAEWGIAQNTQVCGFGSPGTMYVGYFSISECAGKLYVVFNQYLNFYGNYGQASQIDDCASGGFSSRLYAANGEILLCVSSDLDGLLWDAARNLTNTYTPNCDSATGGGLCMNDTRATMSRYGQTVSPSWIWPGSEKVDPSGSYTGNDYLHILYTEDHFPGPGWRAPATFGPLTENELRWMRLACVDPVVAAQIATTPNAVGYPSYVKHGQSATIPVTVRNDGNTALNVTAINKVQTTGPAGWLQTSASSLTVPAGLSNTATFNVIVNNGGVVNSPGTIVALDGHVVLVSNAANRPSDSIMINYIVADTVVDVAWDTVRTDVGDVAMAPGRVALIASNHGEMGRSGVGRVNLDYAANGAGVECDTTKEVYLYSGAPVVLRNEGGGNYSMTSSIFQQNFASDVAFKPVHDGEQPADISTAAYSGYHSGTFVNEDSTIAVTRTYYAPKGGGANSDFVIVRTRFYSYDGLAHTNLMLGEMIDWDVPASVGATNKTAIEGSNVIVRGTDTGTVSCSNKIRFAASHFLGMRKTGDPACANDANKHGQFANRNDSTVFTADNGVFDPAALWTKSAVTGLVALPPNQDSTDVNIVTTYKHGFNLGANDTLTTWSAVTTVRQGTQADLAANFVNACAWYQANLRSSCTVCGCCVGSVGNVDADPGDAVDISDLTVLIDHLFINNAPLVCPDEGNTDGNPGVDISDLTVLIDHLFINNNPLPAC